LSEPSFSIIVPTYQRRDLICAAVRALSAIDYSGEAELIVVVDGSTDGTAAALEELDCRLPLRVVVQDNAGAAAARNRGASEAVGDVLLFLDDDMICRPDILRQHARSHAQGADAVLGHIPLDPGSPKTFLAAAVGTWAEKRSRDLAAGADMTLFDLVSGNLSVRRSVFEAVGGFDTDFTAGGTYGNEDLDLGLRLRNEYRLVFNPDAVASQRYVVSAADNIRQWRDAGHADVRFARKHPERARELFALHGSQSPVASLLLRPLARSDALARGAARVAVHFAQGEAHYPAPVRAVAAQLFRLARDVAYWSGVREAGGMPGDLEVLVLCYHAIADLSNDRVLAEYGIAPDAFAAQLDDLLERGFTFIRPDELLALLDGKAGVPRRAALLTFDDCYEELPEVARDVLRPRGIEAIAFAVTGMKSGTNEWDQAIGARRLRLADQRGLQELRGCGVEIGCHSRSHKPMRSLAESVLSEEIGGSARDLSAIGPRPRFFAYPHGAHDERARAAVREAEFEAAFGLVSRRAGAARDRFALPRVEILARDAGWRFRVKTRWPALAPLTRMRQVVLTWFVAVRGAAAGILRGPLFTRATPR
jgi:glycosyltransferase involved in cell wall biosynthesis/peptidoglycan/xylan/chitin deacetylase (PgdA/CDA1 family)